MTQLIENKQRRPTLIANECIVFAESYQTGLSRMNLYGPRVQPYATGSGTRQKERKLFRSGKKVLLFAPPSPPDNSSIAEMGLLPAAWAPAPQAMGPLTKEPRESAKAVQDSARSDHSASQEMHTASFDAFGIEIPVQLQVGHPSVGATDAYQEDTSTVIVFPQGAVLRLSTKLAAGQHLVLKNQKTNQEVACRVANLRSYSTDYVEIEFIRPAPGFWGVIFPSEASKPAAARVAPAAASPKPAASSPLPAAKSPIRQAKAPLARPAPSKDISAKNPPAKAPQPVKLSAAPAAPAAAPPKMPQRKEQHAAPGAAGSSASHLAPVVKEQPVKPSSATLHAPPSASAPSFSASLSGGRETPPITDLVTLRPPVESVSARSNPAAASTALPGSLGSLEEKEHWATLSYGRVSSFQVLDTEEAARDNFDLGAPSPVRERDPRRWPIFIGVSAAVFVLTLGTGAFLLRHHSQKPAVVASSFNPATTPAPEQPNPAAQPQIATSPSPESFRVPVQAPPSVNTEPQPKQTPSSTAEIVRPQPKIEAPLEIQPTPKISFKLAPSAAAPQRASVSRGTPQPPAVADEVTASPVGSADISKAVMPDTLPGDADIPPPPPAKTPERIGGEVKLPQLLHMVPPSYPLAAKQFNLQGEVTVEASVDATGKVVDAKVISGPGLLQQAAVDAVRRWKYAPATLDGNPVPMQVVVKVRFRLN